MNRLLKFPRQAAYNRVIPKNKIYEKTNVSAKVRRLFVDQIERIRWSNKLSPSTLNLPAAGGVEEIQIFTVDLRGRELNYEILRTIDKAIPSPIIFVLSYRSKLRYVAAYKRASEADRNKHVVSGYFESEWIPEDAEQTEMPMALDMGQLYQALLKLIMPLAPRRKESLPEVTARLDQLRLAEREAARLESRMSKEKQFKLRVELNRRLNQQIAEIEKLKI